MKYVLDIDLVKGYEKITIGMLDKIIKDLFDRGLIKINKKEKIGKTLYETIEYKLNEYKRRYK